MFLIEKCVVNNVCAAYTKDSSHLWVQAWGKGKAIIDGLGVDNAVSTFVKLTSKVRSAPYRIRTVCHSPVTLAAINTNDEDDFKWHSLGAVIFNAESALNSKVAVNESIGAVIPGTGGLVAGATAIKDDLVQRIVEECASALSGLVASHDVEVRYNSDGKSGGAWLKTSLVEGLLTNSDVGLTYSASSNMYALQVSNKFLASPAHGNSDNCFNGLRDHYSQHETLAAAITTLQEVVKQASKAEIKYFQP
tara:strand:- start:9316 stop:10062 length:747 start_codon:yes stop_codon:yes gene_type:complete